MMLKTIFSFSCFLMLLSGCATTASRHFFTDRYAVEMSEFERGYEDGIALVKTAGIFSVSPRNVPDFMEKIVQTETESYQKGFYAGYRDQQTVNKRRFAAVYWGGWGIILTVVILSNLLSEA